MPTRDHNADLLRDITVDERRDALKHLLALAQALDWWGRNQLGALYWLAGIPDADDLSDEPPPLDAPRAETALQEFAAWATTGEAEDEAVATLLTELPWQVILEQPRWVGGLLAATEGERHQHVARGLRTAAFGGVFGRARIARIAETAGTIAAGEQSGSPMRKLYQALEHDALDHQERERRDDEEMEAGWR